MRVECQVCGRMVGKGPDGLGIKMHSKTHRKQYVALTGEEPDDYAEVRERLADRDSEQARFARFEEGETGNG
ncbi:hypothetical protein ACKVMT_09615 [Halobacteriales archaeon Cl-PHB]